MFPQLFAARKSGGDLLEGSVIEFVGILRCQSQWPDQGLWYWWGEAAKLHGFAPEVEQGVSPGAPGIEDGFLYFDEKADGDGALTVLTVRQFRGGEHSRELVLGECLHERLERGDRIQPALGGFGQRTNGVLAQVGADGF